MTEFGLVQDSLTSNYEGRFVFKCSKNHVYMSTHTLIYALHLSKLRLRVRL